MEKMEFIDCKKITDVLMYLDKNIKFSICASLTSKDKNSNERFFESEYMYSNANKFSITRNTNVYFQFTDARDFKNSLMVRIGDLMMFRLAFQNIAYNWFVGKNRIYSIKDDQLVISGKFDIVELAIDDYNVFKMIPIVCLFKDGRRCEGARIFINSNSTFADVPITKFWQLYYIIMNLEPYTYAATMINYAKTKPYIVNPLDNGRSDFYENSNGYSGGNAFFK